MARQKSAVEVVLEDGRKVILRELSTTELRRALELANRVKGEAAQGYEQTLQGIRLAVVEIDGAAMKYSDLDGDKIDDLFGVRDLALLGQGWRTLHVPEEGLGNFRTIAR
jgi:hypothetical protein